MVTISLGVAQLSDSDSDIDTTVSLLTQRANSAGR
jgi:hypothetical protein